jgi:hypothetical protein
MMDKIIELEPPEWFFEAWEESDIFGVVLNGALCNEYGLRIAHELS